MMPYTRNFKVLSLTSLVLCLAVFFVFVATPLYRLTQIHQCVCVCGGGGVLDDACYLGYFIMIDLCF
jgi:hypothetical protein